MNDVDMLQEVQNGIKSRALSFEQIDKCFETLARHYRQQDATLREAVRLLQDAIDLPFSRDEKTWKGWCEGWRPQAEKVITEAKCLTK